jgi:hypothetical protein
VPRRAPLNQWVGAYACKPDDIKTVLPFPDASP